MSVHDTDWEIPHTVLDINSPYCVRRSTESIPVSLLRPSHVAEFVDRFDELQRRLGLSLPTSPP
jgi:hypothetical protein